MRVAVRAVMLCLVLACCGFGAPPGFNARLSGCWRGEQEGAPMVLRWTPHPIDPERLSGAATIGAGAAAHSESYQIEKVTDAWWICGLDGEGTRDCWDAVEAPPRPPRS